MDNYWSKIIGELNQVDVTVDDKFVDFIHDANRIFVIGAGRSGLAIKAFAMRLSQLGKQAFVVGETTNPPITEGDVIVVASGSGTTAQAVMLAQKAQTVGAKVGLITTSRDTPLTEIAEQVVFLGGKAKYEENSTTVQPMGSLFEQSVFLYGDAFVLGYMEKFSITESEMQQRHANLE
ncbi:6-phospho 3-hexuloisomerase [Lentilactobacillus curieae]|uniref:6-phospho 3-hexuloisomerase n=1 Tax=Lentilactobacillus curieae TaxID=1138822 RepID=A0A1S6QHT7_9LACO|nr:6-phospho-3-hexuloisomerase [Lentilactobacillus curieae]AQW21178.1 6-phospho 3-hexuloisomerase [Lentilactobacillus curieae]